MAKRFIWNRNISGTVGKLPQGKFWPVTAAKYWSPVTTDIHRLLEHVGKGHPWSPGIFDGNRAKCNVIEAQAIALDIDDGLTIAEAMGHPFIARYAAAIYPSPSHQKDKNGVRCDRYRIVFLLAEPVHSVPAYEKCVAWVMAQVKAADPACKDASRFFYGSAGGGLEPFLVQPDAVLPPSVATDAEAAIAREKEQERRLAIEQKQRRNERRKQRYQNSDGNRVDAIPLEVCLAREERTDLASGTPKGGRNQRGYILGRSLLGTHQWLLDEGYRPDGDPFTLLQDWAKLSGISEAELKQIWASANRGNPRPSLPDDALITCINAYRWKSGDRSPDLKDARANRRSLEKSWKKPAVQVKWKHNPYAIELRRESPTQVGTLSCAVPGIGCPEIVTREMMPERILERIKQGFHPHIASDLGAGKTYFFGQLVKSLSKLLEKFQGVYTGKDYRNALTSTLEGLPIMPAKYDALVRELKDGKEVFRRLRPGEKTDGLTLAEGTCPGAEIFNQAAAAGLPLFAGKDCAVCQMCPNAKITRDGSGEVVSLTCPYLDKKREVSQQQAYRAYPTTVAAPKDDHIQIMGWDEAGVLLSLTTQRGFNADAIAAEKIKLEVRCRSMVGLDTKIPHVLAPLYDALLAALPQVKANKAQRFGLDANVLRRRLSSAIDEVAKRWWDAAKEFNTSWDSPTPSRAALRFLAKACDRILGEDPNKRLGLCTDMAAQHHLAETEFVTKFTGDLLRSLVSPERDRRIATMPRNRWQDEKGKWHFTSNLEIAKRDRRTHQILNTPNRVHCFMDGTEKGWELRQKTGLNIWSIATPKPNYRNLNIVLLGNTFKFATDRTDDGRRGAVALLEGVAELHPGETIGGIDYRRFHNDYERLGNRFKIKMLERWSESRGCNRLEDVNVLFIAGLPQTNMGSAAIDYGIQYRRTVSPGAGDSKFQAWLYRQLIKELIQEIGRLRAQRSPNTPQYVYIGGAGAGIERALRDYYPTANITRQEASKIAPQSAGEKSQRTASRLVEGAIAVAKDNDGELPTQAKLAQSLGTSPKTLQRAIGSVCSQGFHTFRKVVKTLLSNPYRGMTTFEAGSPEEDCRRELDAIGCAHHFGAATATETVEALEREFKRYGESFYLRAVGAVTTYGRAG